jgi:hypothetical protein
MNSAALVADGYHARTDGLTSLAVVGGAIGVWLGYPLADPIIGLLITIAIFGIVWQSAKAVITRSLDGVDPSVTQEIRHAAEHVPGLARLVNVNIAVDQELSVAEASIAVTLKQELREHLPPLDWTTVEFDTTDVITAAGAGEHHHAPDPFRFKGKLATGELRIIDTAEGERMQLAVTEHAEALHAVVVISRPGGKIETLPLEASMRHHHTFQSTIAPAEPHEFDATLELTAGAQREALPFHMAEPEGHNH